MSTPTQTRIRIERSSDLPKARELVRRLAVKNGFSLTAQTKLVTATSELARNMIVHARGGVLRAQTRSVGAKTAIVLEFEDQGPGIPDVELALTNGYSTGSGLGLGLGGSRRLTNEFEINSVVGRGTLIRIAQWK